MRKPSSKALIKQFLLENIGVVVTSAQIGDASGNASEWARRVRELRDEEGWPIITHNDSAAHLAGSAARKARREVHARSFSKAPC